MSNETQCYVHNFYSTLTFLVKGKIFAYQDNHHNITTSFKPSWTFMSGGEGQKTCMHLNIIYTP